MSLAALISDAERNAEARPPNHYEAGNAILIDPSRAFIVGKRYAGTCSECCMPFIAGDRIRVVVTDKKPNPIVHERHLKAKT